MHLVLLALEPPEESADALVLVCAIDDEANLVLREIFPRDIEPDLRLAGRALQLRKLRAVMGLAPRLDGALLDRFRAIRHDEVHVQLDDVAEPVTGGARAERVVEREQPRLGIFVLDPASPALEALGKQMDDW